MNNKSFIATGILAVLAIGLVSAFSGFGLGSPDLSSEDMAVIEAQRTAVQSAIESGDYSAWKTAMEDNIARMQASVTEDNFNIIVERNSNMKSFKTAMEEARVSGDFSKVEELRAEYGIEAIGFGRGKGMREKGSCPLAN